MFKIDSAMNFIMKDYTWLHYYSSTRIKRVIKLCKHEIYCIMFLSFYYKLKGRQNQVLLCGSDWCITCRTPGTPILLFTIFTYLEIN